MKFKAHQHYPDLILSQYLSEYEGYMRRIRKGFTFPSLKEYLETISGNVKVLHDRLLRPAMVGVSKAGDAAVAPSNDQAKTDE